MMHRISLFVLFSGIAAAVGCQDSRYANRQYGPPGYGPHLAGRPGMPQGGDPFLGANPQYRQQAMPQQYATASQQYGYPPQQQGYPQMVPGAKSVQSSGGNTVVQAGYPQAGGNPMPQYAPQAALPMQTNGWQANPTTQPMPVATPH